MIQENNEVIFRFPRLGNNTDNSLHALRTILEEQALPLIASLMESRIGLGVVFIRIRATHRHGEWKRYYHKNFESRVPYRSGLRYMKLAAKAYANSKKARLAFLKPGMDKAKYDATEAARVEVGDVTRPTPEPVYRLALHLGPTRRAATIRLWASPRRLRAEKKMITRLDEILIEFGFTNKVALGGRDENDLARA